jgi:polyisoprenoid-binding protein YceI
MIRLAPPAAAVHVLVFREGLLSGFGHDLELAVTRFDVRVDEAARRVDASFDAASLRVLRALRDGVELPGGLSDADRRTIEDSVRRDVLAAGRFPEIGFRSTRVVDAADGFDVAGRLKLHGVERDVAVPLRRAGDRWTAEVGLRQPDFGIAPYSAFLGALRVKPDVVVRLSLPAEPRR